MAPTVQGCRKWLPEGDAIRQPAGFAWPFAFTTCQPGWQLESPCLKGWKESGWIEQMADPDRTIGCFEQVLAELRQLSRAVSEGPVARSRPANIRRSLERAAETAGVGLELRITGDEGWLTERQVELVHLVGVKPFETSSGIPEEAVAGSQSMLPAIRSSGKRATGGSRNPARADGDAALAARRPGWSWEPSSPSAHSLD